MRQQELEQVLRQVPETRLKVVEMAERLVGPEGRMPTDLPEEELLEMESAAQEVERYTWNTKRVHRTLGSLIFPRPY